HCKGRAGFGPLVLAHVDKTIIGKTFGTRFVHLLGPTAERGQELVDQSDPFPMDRIRGDCRFGFVEQLERVTGKFTI
ncbi:MAG: hypothetical protein VW879_16645, partial [Opitutae bacterium]